ncbi:tail fiber protein [Pectinatus frisingensis]|uniref:tail fiber protein n=1 Tax=Pectinatus frisingensis TaxID=865 RepID=UPI0018C45136|nr:tail fiber protein [Pectinatus frisingensis]
MAVSNTVIKNIYILNKSTMTFSYTFDISNSTDIHLFLYNTNTSVETEITSGFTVDATAKTVTWADAVNYDNTYKLTLSRETALTQLLTLINEGSFFAEDIMDALDKLTYITQEQAEALNRSVKVQISDITTPDELLAKLNEEASNAETAASNAGNAATAAAASQAAAKQSETNAAGSAAIAVNSAEIAQNAATTAASDTEAILLSKLAPVGSGNEYYGDTAPAGYLFCDGSAVSRTTYADLFVVLGTKFGTGDGSTTFNLPDRRKRVGVGLDSTDTDFAALGNTGGEKTHALTIPEMPSHAHGGITDAQGTHNHSITLNARRGSNGTSYAGWGADDTAGWNGTNWVDAAGSHGHNLAITNTGGDGAHNNMQPYIVVNYIIKY